MRQPCWDVLRSRAKANLTYPVPSLQYLLELSRTGYSIQNAAQQGSGKVTVNVGFEACDFHWVSYHWSYCFRPSVMRDFERFWEKFGLWNGLKTWSSSHGHMGLATLIRIWCQGCNMLLAVVCLRSRSFDKNQFKIPGLAAPQSFFHHSESCM